MAVGMGSELVPESALEFETATGMCSNGHFFQQICLEKIQEDWLAPQQLRLLCVFEMDMIAIMEKCWADWEYRY